MGAERVSGEDAIFLRFERPDTYTHTLKIAVLDPARHGAQVTLADLRRVVGENLHLSPRATQRLGRLPGTRAWAWVEDDDFDLDHHLEEVVAPPPGDRSALDRVCGDVLVRQLDRRHPLWAMTLVHGLQGGRQAVVVRIHHAIADGKATINLLHAATTATPTEPRSVPERTTDHRVPDGRHRLRNFWRAARENKRRVRTFGTVRDLPTLSRRTPFNAVAGKDRLCASTSLDFEDLREVAHAAGVTVNGAFHGVVAGAMRRELETRGFAVDRKLVAAFGVAASNDPGRRFGNDFATSFAYLHADVADPVERLHAAAENAARAVRLRWATGFDYYRVGAEVQQFVLPPARAAFANVTPIVGNQITLANVPGPAANRWVGDVEVVDWISHSIAIAPSVISLTGYSYNGRLSLGLTVAPEAVPDPQRFLGHVAESLEELLGLVRGRGSLPRRVS